MAPQAQAMSRRRLPSDAQTDSLREPPVAPASASPKLGFA
ncbi:MAG: hypothetical protein QOK20_2207 [Acidimicrobiaceae bacterium]|jgi:hypothetical protein|nr:hypothetical protein [Acidimicrobiaceae bacterium]